MDKKIRHQANRVGLAAEQWRREMPELEIRPMEILGNLRQAALLISQDYLEPFFREHGLQRGEFDVLATLRRSGKPYALSPTELFETLFVSSGGMTSRLDRLERAGLIERRPNPEDRRGTVVSLTEAGLELINRLIPRHVDNEAQALAGLTVEEQDQLNTLLYKLLDQLAEG